MFDLDPHLVTPANRHCHPAFLQGGINVFTTSN